MVCYNVCICTCVLSYCVIVIADIPLFGNAMYGCLMTGSNYDRFCYELGRSGFLCWMLSFLYTGFQGDMLKVCHYKGLPMPMGICMFCVYLCIMCNVHTVQYV